MPWLFCGTVIFPIHLLSLALNFKELIAIIPSVDSRLTLKEPLETTPDEL